ncbi:M14 family metallopeptidase [Pleomorphovibrio marinus]|uniref:M14 family metallopeptidase n=1 Tax=Pleomorphovibrio marinus TaxID=2164132 RepID=UPI000E0BC281|nr:M14 family metallopeptidase [Pleomorphovibrio marinus]
MAKALLVVTLALLAFDSPAQGDYPTLQKIEQRLKDLESKFAEANLKSLGQTLGGKEIWALEIGTGDLAKKPAMVIAGGVEGYHLLGVELSLQFAEKLLADHKNSLQKSTFYIFPNLSPDAYEQYFSSLKYERRGNAVEFDHDRDGQISEDGYEDLNGDGLITMMRVATPIGGHVPMEGRPELLRPAKKNQGEKGQYLYLSEGTDKDKDGDLNEDPEEGIAFNKSLTYQFPAFEPLAGDYPVSQVESRLLLDYLYEHPNIYTVFTFGPADNLSKPLAHDSQKASQRVVTSIQKEDETINTWISEKYKELLPDEPFHSGNQGTDGDFFQWAYFHFGRLSLSTPGWFLPGLKNPEGKNHSSKEANFLTWADSVGMQDVTVAWTKVEHPDFPDNTVEVGGIKPFVLHNPPFDQVDSLGSLHSGFIAALSEMHPQLEFMDVKTKALDRGLTRITVKLHNDAPLPTHTALGQKSRWLKKIRVDISTEAENLLSGNKITLIDYLDAYGSQELTWIVKGKGDLTIQAGAPHTGFTSIDVKL